MKRFIVLSLLFLILSGCSGSVVDNVNHNDLLEVSPNGKYGLYSTRAGDGVLNYYIKDLENGKKQTIFEGLKQSIGFSQHWSSDSLKIVISSERVVGKGFDCDFFIYNLTSRKRFKAGVGSSFEWLPNSQQFTIGSSMKNAQEDWIERIGSISTPGQLKAFGQSSNIGPICWTRDSKYCAASLNRENLAIFDNQGKLISRLKAYVIDPAWSPDGRYLIYGSDATWIYDMVQRKEKKVCDLVGTKFAWGLDSTTVAIAGQDGIYKIDLLTGSLKQLYRSNDAEYELIINEAINWIDDKKLYFIGRVHSFSFGFYERYRYYLVIINTDTGKVEKHTLGYSYINEYRLRWINKQKVLYYIQEDALKKIKLRQSL